MELPTNRSPHRAPTCTPAAQRRATPPSPPCYHRAPPCELNGGAMCARPDDANTASNLGGHSMACLDSDAHVRKILTPCRLGSEGKASSFGPAYLHVAPRNVEPCGSAPQ